MFGLLKHAVDIVAPTGDGEGEQQEDPVAQQLREIRRIPALHTEGSPEVRAKDLTIPEPMPAAGSYSPVVVIGDMCFVSGQTPWDGEKILKGKVSPTAGEEGTPEDYVNEEAAVQAARQVGLNMLATLKKHLGSLDTVCRVVKVTGFVNSTSDFENHPKVLNGFSDLMIEVFGDAGKAARSAVGMGSLPFNMTVEVEAIFQLCR
ncbi:hypothetical protein CYMTET_41813 [Cymbomonas tetramitiformis]|uniref:Endoribonuclease L-PSP/chorismate mutase-like domain-containing protein n=1 Tax=Cymbomonas tetramitiformis TaxID=36881 RepID=A0AAE0C5F7_9CHLO|nr:hypothetical protein CYMTET_41813 [Cymbomonas tetramitiformis]